VYGKALKLSSLRGVVRDMNGVEIPGACVGVFTELEHRPVGAICAEADGKFNLQGIKDGSYRLVVKVDGFCAANSLIVLRSGTHQVGSLLAKMRPQGIDTCSWIELK
jgi:hypothetical protein